MHTCFFTSEFWFMSFLIMILILILAPTSVFANDGNISICSGRFNCGDVTNIGYPFWVLDRPASCGYPGFRLNCNEDSREITINSATYRVLEINTSAQVMKVARIDYTDNICPANLLNSNFTSSPFEYRDSRDITLFYGCQSLAQNPASFQGISSQFECTVNGTDMIGYYLTRDMSEASTIVRNTLGSCTYSVTISVMNSAFPSLENVRDSDTLEEALSAGFELRWSANDSLCDACVQSGGQCGHKLESAEFVCYCSGGSYATDCNVPLQGEKKNNVGLTIGLAIAGAVIAAILLGIGIVRFKQRQSRFAAAEVKNRDLPTPPSSKQPYTSTTNLSQTIPSYPTSEYDIERGSTYFGAHVFSYQELEEATCNFNPAKQLGEGGFGTVYYGVLNDGRAVAVKRLYESSIKRVDQYMNEIQILTRIRHPNLVTLYGCTSKRSRELLLVYEYISNGTVADHLHAKLSDTSLLTWPVRLSIAVETANALAYLHASDIIHRDVKTNNILLDINFNVKVADFGLSRLFPTDVTHVSTAPQGTPGYVDPEYYQCYQLSEKSDVYSFGVVLIELISAKQAVDTNRSRDDINLANMGLSRIRNHALHELVDSSLGFENDCAVKTMVTRVAELASRCLQKERDSRPSMEEVLQILRGIEGDELGVQKA